MSNNISLFSNINLFSHVFNDHFEKTLTENNWREQKVENTGIDPITSRMLSERSTI